MLCGKGWVRTRTLGTKAERYDHCATPPVGQRGNISLALDTARIGGQTLLQEVAREQAGGVGEVGPTG